MAVKDAVSTIGTRAMLSAFAALGLDTRRIQADAGIDDDLLADPDRLLPTDRFYRMWELADRAWGHPAVGMHAGLNVPFGAYEVLDYLLLSSGTLEAGMMQFARYFAVTTRTAQYRISVEGTEEAGAVSEAVCEMVWRIPPRGVMFHLRDFSFAVLIGRLARAGAGRPDRVELSGPVFASAEEYTRGFGARTLVRESRSALVFSLDAWRRPLARRDDDLNRTLARHAQLLLQRQPADLRAGAAERVRAELLQTVRVGSASIGEVAARMGMSPRSLQRRLRAERSGFETICQEVRTNLAQQYLRDPGLNISEVGYLLGFSESSAFSRAFRRWTGRTPHEFRTAAPPAERGAS